MNSFKDNPDEIFTATTKAATVVDNYSTAVVFCFFDTEEGDLWDYLWFVPAPDLLKLANQLDGGRRWASWPAERGRKVISGTAT